MADDAAHSNSVERRKNQRLRELVDEMLASIREAAGRELWTDAERAQYEVELEGIMARVRRQATTGAGGPADEQASGGQKPGGGDASKPPRRPS
jgi:hypothetical protein